MVLHHDWLMALLFLVLAGCVASLLALVVAPRASMMAVAAIESEPARCLIVGFLGMLGLTLIGAVNEELNRTIVWAPVGVLVELASGLLSLYSLLLGIVFMGGRVARRLGGRAPGFFARAALGFLFLGLVALVPVVNAFVAFVALGAFLLGLGGLIVTGFGQDPGWLTRFLSRNRPGGW